MANYRYGRYVYGPDPLALPFDVRGAVDEMGDAILAGANPADALREMLRRGLGDQAGRRGLDDLLRRVRDRQREIRGSGRLDGILEQARALLDTAVGQERAELFPDPSDEARLREADLDALPADTAQAIRQLADYDWRSPAARQTFDRLRELLRSEVLDSQFRFIIRVGTPCREGLLDLAHHGRIVGKHGVHAFAERLGRCNSGHFLRRAVPDDDLPLRIGHHHAVNDPGKDIGGQVLDLLRHRAHGLLIAQYI